MGQVAAINSEVYSVDRSDTVQAGLSRGAIAGRFVTSWFESLCYLDERRKHKGQACTGRPSFRFEPDPAILADRVVACVCPQYRLLTTAFPEASLSELSVWLPQAAARAVSAGWEAVPAMNPGRVVKNLLTVARDAFGLAVLACVPTALATPYKIGSARDFLRIGQDLPGNGSYLQTAHINLAGSTGALENFAGIYDGQGYAISNFGGCVFRGNVGIVRNLEFRDAEAFVSVNDPVAVYCRSKLPGEIHNIVIEDVWVISQSPAPAAYILETGLAFDYQKMSNITIRNCHAIAVGKRAVASIVHGSGIGSIDNVRVEKCTAFADASGFGSFFGGIAGVLMTAFQPDENYKNVEIVDCSVFAKGSKSSAGMVVGMASPSKINQHLLFEMGNNITIKGGSVSVSGASSGAGLITGTIEQGASISLKHVLAECVSISATGPNARAGLIYGATYFSIYPGSVTSHGSIPVITNDTVACNIRVNGVINDDYCPGTNASCPVFKMPTDPDLPIPAAKVAPTTKIPEDVTDFKKINNSSLENLTLTGGQIALVLMAPVLFVVFVCVLTICMYGKKRSPGELSRSLPGGRRPPAGGQNSQGRVRYNVVGSEVDVEVPQVADRPSSSPPPYSYHDPFPSIRYTSDDGAPTIIVYNPPQEGNPEPS